MSPDYTTGHELEEFEAVFEHAKQMVSTLSGPDGETMTHGEAEKYIKEEGNELLRRMLQGYFDTRANSELRHPAVHGQDGVVRTSRRSRDRDLESLFGTVKLSRRAYEQEGAATLHVLDAELNLPKERYSHGLEEVVSKELSKVSTDATVTLVDEMTGGHVPKRQVLSIADKVSQDFEEFYERVARPHPDPIRFLAHHLVLTVDGKGIVMRPEGLREATRKAAMSAKHKKKTRLSKGEKRNRKRMATVASVYNIESNRRTPEDVLHSDSDEPAIPHPRPVDKRVWASVERSGDRVIEEMIEEGLRRDPKQWRPWVILVDGERTQLRRIKAALKRHDLDATIIVDFIHVLEYIWKAAYAFYEDKDDRVEGWVLERALRVLQGKSSHVAAGIRRSATRRGITDAKRKAVDACASYLLKYKAMLRYDAFLDQGFPIATGVIEGACRHLINDRLDITGARWSLKGAEAVLKLRSLNSSGDFDAYLEFYRAQEYQRNYASKIKPIPLQCQQAA